MIDRKQIEAYDKNFPEIDWKKIPLTFNDEELRSLQEWSPILKAGQFAEVMINNILNTVFLKRIGIPTSPDVGILYDVVTRNVIVYVPRVWCSRCLEHQKEWITRRAQYQVEGKVYCAGCVDYLKTLVAEKIEKTKQSLESKKPSVGKKVVPKEKLKS